ncbi:YfhO family protein [Nonlabens xiamenensis]|uniref:YfhO family protein n=1 Tax=Nonlabens xiamenensis TaxID=2341043 RepID=UPI000F61338C|nr:YfhO family protein [Nonlabens xiamenensis]
MSFNVKKLLPHLAVFVVFIIASLAYFHPVLSGKKLFQNDIVQYKGNARQLIDHREQTGEETYWTDAVFGGMPTYQLGARYDYDWIDQLDRGLRFLPRPADYLFLYFFSFYVLMLVMRVDWKIGLLGAFAFGFSTYLIIILGVGHNAKAHAIAYFPLVLSGIILVFQKRYLLGFVVTALAMALELQANHPQMTYYLLIGVVILGLAYLVDAIKKKWLPHYFTSIGIMVVAVVLALGTNAANLMATSEYSKESTRGPSPISINAQGENLTPTPGLEYDYITQYSYGLSESLNLMIPRFAGGGSGETPGEDSQTVEYLQKMGLPKADAVDFASQIPTYWGAQPIVEAPAYLGVSVVFLAFLSLFLLRGRLKWWTLGTIVLALLLSYGDNLAWLTKFFINNIPFYNKFRAVTSIQVLIELCVPILAAVGLYQFFNERKDDRKKAKALMLAAGSFCAFLLILAVGGQLFFDFAGPIDAYLLNDEQLGSPFVDELRRDRFNMMQEDVFKALLFIGGICLGLWLYLKGKFAQEWTLLLVGVVILVDLVGFNLNYVNEEDYVTAREYAFPYQKTSADDIALKDDGHFRVYDQLADPVNSGRASYFHNAFGGYHGAKPHRFQDIFDFYMLDPQGRSAGVNARNIEVLSMFNVKYFLGANEQGTIAQTNPQAMGNAWFVNKVKEVPDQNAEIQALEQLSGDSLAVITRQQKEKLGLKQVSKDSTAQIQLTSYDPERLVYKTQNSQPGLAVFSEMYYPHGWKATIDGQEVPIARVNYALRGLNVPAGTHEVTFSFEPEVVATGSLVMLLSNILLLLVILGGVIWLFKKSSSPKVS